MPKLLDQILVIDLESTCWEGPPPAGMTSEIIEIGLCVVDVRRLERIEKRCLLVRPVNSQVSPFCTQLTTLTAADVQSAPLLADAARVLKSEYRGPERLWASWGDYDRVQLQRCCQDQAVPYPFGGRHLNVKSLFAVAHGLSKEIGLDAAYAQLGEKLEGTHHRGVDDAWNIAGLLCRLLAATRR
jgi:inhibitor of KinA sporulation pathway (predicted exonuclease)